jgi:hypothetical protein
VKRFSALAATVLLAAALIAPFAAQSANAATPKVKAGAACTAQKTSSKVKVSGKTLVCTKNAKGVKVWKVVKASVAAPATTAPISSFAVGEPNPSAPNIGIYPIVLDPNGGGSSDPTPRTPEQAEALNPALDPAPTGLAVSNITDNSVLVTWDPIPEGTLYQVYIRYDDSYESFGVDSSYTSHAFRNLTPGWNYTVGIHEATPRESNIATVAFRTTGTTPNTTPTSAGPSSVTGIGDDNSVTVSWSAVEGASYYPVAITDNGIRDGGVTSYGEPGLSHTFTGLEPGKTYRVMVAAIINGSITRETVAYINTTNTHPALPAPLTSAQLYAPTNLHVVSVTPTTVTVAWDEDSAGGITLWNVYARYLSSYTSTGFDGADRQATMVNLNPGFSYEIGVKGFDGSNWSSLVTVGLILPSA